MAVIVLTDNPSGLLKSVRNAINNKAIDTWSFDSDGDFTHTATQWVNKAWLHPTVQTDRLIFTTINPQGKTISTTIYGIYHGRFIEMLLNHFDGKFTQAYATALPDFGDLVSGA